MTWWKLQLPIIYDCKTLQVKNIWYLKLKDWDGIVCKKWGGSVCSTSNICLDFYGIFFSTTKYNKVFLSLFQIWLVWLSSSASSLIIKNGGKLKPPPPPPPSTQLRRTGDWTRFNCCHDIFYAPLFHHSYMEKKWAIFWNYKVSQGCMSWELQFILGPVCNKNADISHLQISSKSNLKEMQFFSKKKIMTFNHANFDNKFLSSIASRGDVKERG